MVKMLNLNGNTHIHTFYKIQILAKHRRVFLCLAPLGKFIERFRSARIGDDDVCIFKKRKAFRSYSMDARIDAVYNMLSNVVQYRLSMIAITFTQPKTENIMMDVFMMKQFSVAHIHIL